MKAAGAAAGLALVLVLEPASAQRERPRTVQSPIEAALGTLSTDALRAHQRFLSDTILGATTPGSRGGAVAARYIAAQFEALGLKPAAPDGSYFHQVTLLGVTSEASLVVGAGRQTIALDAPEEFVAWAETPDSTVTADGEVVFAGYGIEAPEWGWDDYKGVPQTGKIVLVLADEPRLPDSTAQATRPGPYGRWTYKLEEAAKIGALGVLLVHGEEGTGIPSAWAGVRDAYAREQVRSAAGSGLKPLRFAAWVRGDVVRRILQTAGRDYDLLLRRARQREFSPIPVGVHAAVDIRSHARRLTALNVVARLGGSDLAGSEVVVLAATLGATGETGRASGVATLLAAAGGFVRLPAQRRPLLFLATTGPLSTEAYLSDPRFPVARAAAAVSVAGERRSEAGTALLPIRGGEYSTIGDVVATAARAEGVSVTGEPGSWYGSGAYPFARAGVPAVEIGSDGSASRARVLLRLGWILASHASAPEWLPGSPFGPGRGRRTL